MARAAEVSRLLAQKFSRSQSHRSRVKGLPILSAGFRVQQYDAAKGLVRVEHIAGSARDFERRRAAIRENLTSYAEHLKARFSVDIDLDLERLIVGDKTVH
jgi:hypothetical protein